MTGSELACAELPASLVTAYADGGLTQAQTWSVEAHLPACRACRAVLAAGADAGRLARNRGTVLARLGTPEPSLAGRALRRCGVPEYAIALLAATPSLRRSWLAGLLLVLAVVVGASQLAVASYGRAIVPGPASPHGWIMLAPFLIIAPLLPLAAVAAAYSPRLDPAGRLATAAPFSAIRLLCLRCLATLVLTLVPTALAALALPGPGWLGPAVLLPSLAICAAALALTTIVAPAAAVVVAAGCWIALVIAMVGAEVRPASVVGAAGQLIALAVLVASAGLMAARRRVFDYGWMR